MIGPVTKLSFWGVRGSTPTVDPATWRYGGNTPCLELTAPDGTQFILDCGTGLRVLGSRWTAPSAGVIASGVRNPETHILVTHYHWDTFKACRFSRRCIPRTTHFISTVSVRSISAATA